VIVSILELAMRHGPRAVCASIGFVLYVAASAPVPASSLGFTLDLLAPSTACSGGNCPSDIVLPLLGAVPFGGSALAYAPASGNFLTTVSIDQSVAGPIVCDEINGSQVGPNTTNRLALVFTNPSPGDLLEFGNGGSAVVDLSSFGYNGVQSPAEVSLSRINTSASQVACYPINPIGVVNPVLTRGTLLGDRVFYDPFEGVSHFASEPWVSVQTVSPPQPSTQFVYVVQVHNASAAIGWRLNFGYDKAFFDPAFNGGFVLHWYVLDSSMPQPGPLNGVYSKSGPISQTYTIAANDIQTATNSVYLRVTLNGSAVASSSWSTLTSSLYPATAAVFAPAGTYAKRLDDKVAVATSNNLPTLNIASIVCPNNPGATSCTIRDIDGNPVPAQVTYQNQFTSGALTVDPLVYFVDPTAGTNLPGNATVDALNVSNVSCADPSGILASPLANGSFSTSTGAQGALALGFAFAQQGAGPLFVPGTATCTATFTTTGYAPTVSANYSFTITMMPATATHFALTVPANTTAGTPFSGATVTALDASNNTVTSYNGTVHFTSSDAQAMLPANLTLSNGTASFSATFKTSGTQTITATDTSNSSLTGTSNASSVAAAVATHFKVNAPATATSGSAFNFAVTALDAFGNMADGYTGTVHFTSTDTASGVILPANSTLTFGVGSFPATLITLGNQTISATDTANPSITGSSAAITVQ
jgi:hypothetical protein